MATRRQTLTGRNGTERKLIDMEEVYHLLDKGVKVDEVAARFGVSRTTLYRHHNRYQKHLEQLEQSGAGDEIFSDYKMEIDEEF